MRAINKGKTINNSLVPQDPPVGKSIIRIQCKAGRNSGPLKLSLLVVEWLAMWGCVLIVSMLIITTSTVSVISAAALNTCTDFLLTILTFFSSNATKSDVPSVILYLGYSKRSYIS